MNKRQIIASLNNIANSLDNSGLYKEANTVTKVMIKMADEFNMPEDTTVDDRTQNKKPLKIEFERQYEKEYHCPNCGNSDERLAYDPSVIIMEKFSNGKVAWCANDNCSYDYWQDAIDGRKLPICPICEGTKFYYRNIREPFENFTCANERCKTRFINGEEQKK